MQRKIVDMNDEYLKRIATDLKEYDHFWNEKILKVALIIKLTQNS